MTKNMVKKPKKIETFDDEDDDVYIKIKIYVKDWVVRKNSSIIL